MIPDVWHPPGERVHLQHLGERPEAQFTPLSDTERRIAVARSRPDGACALDPEGTVISFLDPSHCDVSGDQVISSFCHHILFFTSRDDWRAWAAERDPPTFVLTVEEGWYLGRITNRIRYGDTLDDVRGTWGSERAK